MLFRVQPTAFFQTNTKVTEILMEKIFQICKNTCSKEDEEITVLDICCGTGIIGICVAAGLPNANVIGIDIASSSIQDANCNAKLNNISTVNFIEGDVKTHINKITSSIPSDRKCIAIVDPPRSGLHKKVLNALANCDRIDRLIYVACKPETLVTCLPLLAKSYKPSFSFVVDMFPHTSQIELVMCLDKIKSDGLIKE